MAPKKNTVGTAIAWIASHLKVKIGMPPASLLAVLLALLQAPHGCCENMRVWMPWHTPNQVLPTNRSSNDLLFLLYPLTLAAADRLSKLPPRSCHVRLLQAHMVAQRLPRLCREGLTKARSTPP